MKKLVCAALILCLKLSDIAWLRAVVEQSVVVSRPVA